MVVALLRTGADPSVCNTAGKSSLGLAADHASLESFLEICSNLVGAGWAGSDQDWKLLDKHPRHKLLVMMELLRTQRDRQTLRYCCFKLQHKLFLIFS